MLSSLGLVLALGFRSFRIALQSKPELAQNYASDVKTPPTYGHSFVRRFVCAKRKHGPSSLLLPTPHVELICPEAGAPQFHGLVGYTEVFQNWGYHGGVLTIRIIHSGL